MYTVYFNTTGNYDLIIHTAALIDSATVHIEIDGIQVSESVELNSSGSWDVYDTTMISGITVTKGYHKVKIYFEAGACNLNYFSFYNTSLTEQILELSSGWNLISLYVNPVNPAISNLFSNASIVKTDSLYYSNNQAQYFNTLKNIEHGVGYLVYNEFDETISVAGRVETRLIASLHDGWNFIGCPFSSTTTFEFAFGTEFQDIQIIKNFEGFYEKNNPGGTLSLFEPGKGYYIYK